MNERASERASGAGIEGATHGRTDGRVWERETRLSLLHFCLARVPSYAADYSATHTHTHTCASIPSNFAFKIDIGNSDRPSSFGFCSGATSASEIDTCTCNCTSNKVGAVSKAQARIRRQNFEVARASPSASASVPVRGQQFVGIRVYVPLPSARILAIYGKVEGRIKSASRSDSSSAMFRSRD